MILKNEVATKWVSSNGGDPWSKMQMVSGYTIQLQENGLNMVY